MNDSHTPAYKVFHYKFNYSIPGIHFYSQAYLDTVGIVSTGDKVADKEIMKRPINTRGTIIEIARKFSEDIPVTITNPRDAVEMYEIARDHLHNWKRALAQESNLPDAPMDDLRALDEFATSIFEIARRFKPEVREKESISKRLRALGGGTNLRKGIVAPANVNKVAKTVELPTHHPVIDTIEEYFAKRGGDV
jgi:hypothetical protein